MNFEICKKCFALQKNVIHYMMVTQTHEKFGVLKIVGLISKDAKDFSFIIAPICCTQVVDVTKLDYHDFNMCSMNENEQIKILNKIKEPSTTCKFYCEHIIEELNGKGNYNGCE
jgi:hypothetical protein